MNRLLEQLKNFDPIECAVLGVGNSLKGDDGVGSIIAGRLKNVEPLYVIDTGTVPENFIGKVLSTKRNVLVFIDAMDFGEKPGSYKFFGIEDIDDGDISTHAPSLSYMLEIFKGGGEIQAYVIGIQPETIELGEKISKRVEAAAKDITDIFIEWVRCSA